MTKYQITDSRGQVHKRATDRTYTHAVVFHVPGIPADGPWPARPGYSKAAWCGRADLAGKQAAMWQTVGYAVEIIPVGE